MESLSFLLIALLVLTYGLISRRLEKTIITAPIVFVAIGFFVGPEVLGLISLRPESEVVKLVAELTLVLVLFADAARIDLRLLRQEVAMPIRLLGIGLPLTIIFGTVVAVVFFDALSFWEAAVLAAILAPTDAALGQAVVSSPRVPVRVRQALNVESGLNDGVVVPALLILLSLAGAAAELQPTSFWVSFVGRQLILGPIAGLIAGGFGGWLVSKATRRKWMNDSFQRLSSLALALLAFALAELLGGNGLIAAFVAGLAIGNLNRPVCHCFYEFAEAEGQLLILFTFLIFGAIMVPVALAHVNILIILYAILSLVLIRGIAVAISLLGFGLQRDTVWFLGWFGPRGIASILFGLLVLEEVAVAGTELIFTVVVIAVLLSVFAHGLTAVPAANWYGDRAEAMKDEPDMPEMVKVKELPLRSPFSS